MALTSAQQTALAEAILANTTWNSIANDTDGHFTLAALLNEKASPGFTVWKTAVPIAQVGVAFNATELAGLTTANTSRLQVMADYSGGTFDASKPDVRSGFDTVFSGAGGVSTRASLLILWKRLATAGEKILATGTGSNVAPATLTFEGNITANDVQLARNVG